MCEEMAESCSACVLLGDIPTKCSWFVLNDQGVRLSQRVRKMEARANEVLGIFMELY